MPNKRVRKSDVRPARPRASSSQFATKLPPPPPLPAGLEPFDLRNIANRARLCLECYAATQDSYWLNAAYDDCRAGSLHWDRLCHDVLGLAAGSLDVAATRR